MAIISKDGVELRFGDQALETLRALVQDQRGGLWVTGKGRPAAHFGREGDWYLDQTSGQLYGPKQSGSWRVQRQLLKASAVEARPILRPGAPIPAPTLKPTIASDAPATVAPVQEKENAVEDKKDEDTEANVVSIPLPDGTFASVSMTPAEEASSSGTQSSMRNILLNNVTLVQAIVDELGQGYFILTAETERTIAINKVSVVIPAQGQVIIVMDANGHYVTSKPLDKNVILCSYNERDTLYFLRDGEIASWRIADQEITWRREINVALGKVSSFNVVNSSTGDKFYILSQVEQELVLYSLAKEGEIVTASLAIDAADVEYSSLALYEQCQPVVTVTFAAKTPMTWRLPAVPAAQEYSLLQDQCATIVFSADRKWQVLACLTNLAVCDFAVTNRILLLGKCTGESCEYYNHNGVVADQWETPEHALALVELAAPPLHQLRHVRVWPRLVEGNDPMLRLEQEEWHIFLSDGSYQAGLDSITGPVQCKWSGKQREVLSEGVVHMEGQRNVGYWLFRRIGNDTILQHQSI